MRIISEGELPEKRWFDTTCWFCKTRFEFQQFEGKVTDDQRDGMFVTINCPKCDHPAHVAAKTGQFRPARPTR